MGETIPYPYKKNDPLERLFVINCSQENRKIESDYYNKTFFYLNRGKIRE